MRSGARAWSGGLPLLKNVSSRSLKTFGWAEYVDGKTEVKNNDAAAWSDFVRSGVVAFGKESGQPSQSRTLLRALMSVELERSVAG
ncbi:MAG: hypothetical protein V7638_1443 [Acidobacteriota bacterium]|jgi:hypothetical protein